MLKTKYIVVITLVASISIIGAVFANYYIGRVRALAPPIVELSIHGLNQTYHTGDKIDFYVHLKANKGCDGAKVEVLKLTSFLHDNNQVIQTNQLVRSCGVGMSPGIEQDWHVGENMLIGVDPPIILNQTGIYQIRASMGDTIVNSTVFSMVQ